jgi:Flp pilus assembly protein CpaB
MKGRRIPLIIGLLLALGTGVLLLNFLSSLRTRTIAQSKMVWVATHDIAARMRIDADAVTQESRSGPDLDPDAITDKKSVVGRYTLITIPAGSVLTASKVGEIGSRVGIETPIGSAILRGALVLAVGNETETAQATPSPGNEDLTTVTLAVTPGQADVLASADINTVLRLTLRSPNEPIGAFPAEPLQLGIPPPESEPQAQVQAPAAASAATVAPVRPAAGAPRSGVVLIDGDRIVTGTDLGK